VSLLGDKPLVMCVVGARPNFMKMAPILRALASHSTQLAVLLVHTGQHYDKDMSTKLFDDLGLPLPDINLEVGSGTHAMQTAEVMKRFEPVIDRYKPACVLVVGDVNSTLACALVASKKGVPSVHVEAGLRSGDRAMPEEINRILTDQLSERLYTTERSAALNLQREGIPADRICFVGNVMIDSLKHALPLALAPAKSLAQHNASIEISSERYALVTLHRPSNVDDKKRLELLLNTLVEVSQNISVIFAIHPRTRANLKLFELEDRVDPRRIALLPPQGYFEMLGLLRGATLLLTDSGGLQEESTALGVPCLTLRENTERPITVEQGSNTVVGSDRDVVLAAVADILAGRGKRGRVPELWDGRAAVRIAADIWSWVKSRAAQLERSA
jgi:UDP-N-acetylglucosamine 2-epimerase (non-hydrolysing)